MAPRIELYAFRYRDPRTGKWVRARYVATLEEIARRHAEWQLVGSAEIRDVDLGARHFTPHGASIPPERHGHSEPAPELQPSIDVVEAFLLTVFLRRYVTYCARRGRYAAMNGAARMYAASSQSLDDSLAFARSRTWGLWNVAPSPLSVAEPPHYPK